MRRIGTLLVGLAAVLASLTVGGAFADESSPPYAVRDSNSAKVLLDEARKAIAAGETRRGLESLQRILDRSRDDLAQVSEADSKFQTWYVSAPEAALREIERLPPAARAVYEEMTVPLARPLLEGAIAEHDEGQLRQVIDRYGPSTVGIQAARRLAESAFEDGRPWDAAAAARAALRFAPTDAGLWLRLVDALAAAGDARALADVRLPPDGPAVAPTAAGPVSLAERLAAARARVGPVPAAVDVPQWDGDERHDVPAPWDHALRPMRWSAGSPPLWRRNDDAPFFGMPPEGQSQFERRWGLATPYFPVVTGSRLVVADGASVVAYELLSGRVAWTFPSAARPARGLDVVKTAGESLSGRTNLDVAHVPAVANGLVFAAVEVADPTYVARRLQGIEISTYLPRRVLVALDAETGEMRWHMGERPEDAAILGRLSLGGPPVVADGLVVAMCVAYQERWGAVLVAFDARSGRVRWTRRLVTSQQELNLFGRPIKELWAGAPAVDDGVVYAPTGLGVFVAADLFTGEIRWMSSYEAAQIERVEYWYATPIRLASWGPSPTVVHGDAVLCAPADSPYLHCYDRASGRLRWRERSQATRDSAFVDQFLGVASDGKRDVAVVTGRSVRALALSDGQIAWGARLSQTTLVRGRGALSKTRVYVPTNEGLETFSIPGEGRLLPPGSVPWPERAQAGNVLLTPQVLVVAGGMGPPDEDGRVNPIQAFFAPEDLERALEVRRAAAPEDPGLALEAADLARLVGRDARAEALYGEATRLAADQSDADVMERARQGAYLLWRDRGDSAAAAPGRAGDARTAYEGALARARTAAERIAVRLRLDRLLREKGLETARIRNLEALAQEAEGEKAVFSAKEGVVPARAGARLLLADLHRNAGRAADAVRTLQEILRDDGETLIGDEPARLRAQRTIDSILEEAGPLPYRPFELEAARRLAEASKGTDPAPFERVLAEFPNARAVPEALLGLAERQAETGAPAAAAATLRRFLGAYPDHPAAARALASLARALVATGSLEPARAALAALERRLPDARFELGGTAWTGASFAAAERRKLGAPVAAPPPAPLARRPEERYFQDVDAQGAGARCIEIDVAAAGAVPAPVLVNAGEELVAVDPATARPRWRKAWPNPGRAALVGDALVVGLPEALVALDPATGEERWRREIPGDALDVRGSLGQVVALVRTSGVFARTRLLAVDPVASGVVWSRDLPGEPADRMVVGEDGIAVMRRRATSSGNGAWAVTIHSSLSGEPVRDLTSLVDGSTEATLAVAGGRTLVTWSRDGEGTRVEAYDLSTGKARWSRPVPGVARGYVQRWIFPHGEEVVAAESSGRLLAFALATGEPVRETAVTGGLRVVDRAPFLDRDRLVAVVREGGTRSSLSAFDLATGRAAWSVALKGISAGLVLPAGDVYVAVLTPVSQAMARGGVAQPIEYQILVVDAKEGGDAWRISPRGLGHGIPSAVVEDGALVVAGLRRFAVYR